MSSRFAVPSLTPLETITLVDPDADAWVALAPARGGMATRFEVRGRPVFYLDTATLLDQTKNVRGGNPVLFPSPGPLVGDSFTRDGRSGHMKQHGLARQRPWTVVETAVREATLELASDESTRAEFPWDFVLRIRYALAGATLTIETRVENRSSVALPFALGFHPYFHVPDAEKSRTRIDTNATRAFDNVSKRETAIAAPIDLTKDEVDLHLLDHTPHTATLERANHERIVLTADPEFRRWIVWTLAKKDFVCLEPWTALANALNTGDGLLLLDAGATRTLSMSISID